MMTNKWVQAALCSGFGVGLIAGAVVLAATRSPAIILILGVVFQLAGLWITANARGTDGFGGPYNGPKS